MDAAKRLRLSISEQKRRKQIRKCLLVFEYNKCPPNFDHKQSSRKLVGRLVFFFVKRANTFQLSIMTNIKGRAREKVSECESERE